MVKRRGLVCWTVDDSEAGKVGRDCRSVEMVVVEGRLEEGVGREVARSLRTSRGKRREDWRV